MSESGFGALAHIPHALFAEVKGENGSVLVTLGDDDDIEWAHVAAVAAETNLVMTMHAGALRDLGVLFIECAGRIEARRIDRLRRAGS